MRAHPIILFLVPQLFKASKHVVRENNFKVVVLIIEAAAVLYCPGSDKAT